MKLAIYGAQGYALAVYEAVTTLYPKREISCFLVTHMDCLLYTSDAADEL